MPAFGSVCNKKAPPLGKERKGRPARIGANDGSLTSLCYSRRMTGGQMITMPDEPYLAPFGPVIKPLRAKSRI